MPSWPNPTFTDSDMSLAIPQNVPNVTSPIPGVATEYLLTQDFIQKRESFSPLALNTAHFWSEFSDFLLVEEGERRDLGGGLVRWTRTYAKVPATHYDEQTTGVSLIGMTIALGGGAYQVRTRQQRTCNMLIEFDYFLVPSTFTDPILGGSPISITDPGQIPKIWGMLYCQQGDIGGATYGGVNLQTDALNLRGTVLPTWPTADMYNAMIEDALKNNWNAQGISITGYTTPGYTLSPPHNKSIVKIFDTNTLAPPGGPFTSGHNAGAIDTVNSVLTGIIPPEDSRLVRWRGNIYQRTTKFVLAQ